MSPSDTIENSFILRDHEHFSLKIRKNRIENSNRSKSNKVLAHNNAYVVKNSRS